MLFLWVLLLATKEQRLVFAPLLPPEEAEDCTEVLSPLSLLFSGLTSAISHTAPPLNCLPSLCPLFECSLTDFYLSFIVVPKTHTALEMR